MKVSDLLPIKCSHLAPLPFNPIALRKAKIAYKFGLSECNRVNVQYNILCYRLPNELLVTWPEGNQVVNNEKRNAGKTIGMLALFFCL